MASETGLPWCTDAIDQHARADRLAVIDDQAAHRHARPRYRVPSIHSAPQLQIHKMNRQETRNLDRAGNGKRGGIKYRTHTAEPRRGAGSLHLNVSGAPRQVEDGR